MPPLHTQLQKQVDGAEHTYEQTVSTCGFPAAKLVNWLHVDVWMSVTHASARAGL
jgi:hypothetical protein